MRRKRTSNSRESSEGYTSHITTTSGPSLPLSSTQDPLRKFSDSQKGKKRKKKKKARSSSGESNDKTSKAAPSATTESISSMQSDEKQSSQKRDREDEHDIEQPKKRKKKSKKKKVKNEEVSVDSSNDAVLEGCAVDGQLLLIDKGNGTVYSATEQTEDGSRLVVGSWKDGEIQLLESKPLETSTSEVPQDRFPFETDPDDHCESPVQAYQDVVPLLEGLGGASLRIYDPFYCNGAVIENLKSLGFSNVYNKKEDCYEVWNSPSRYPDFDILITNPPYSADHMEKLMAHITSPSFGSRPWMLLLPQFVHKKDYYSTATSHIHPFYVVPHKRYVYLPPPSFREAKKSDVHKKSSPFVSMWYIWGGTQSQNEKLMSMARSIPGCDVARSKSALRDLRRKKK